MYLIRMFGITGFYHRYFSHGSFRLRRPTQLAAAILGASAAQRGPLWWAAHHRRHHRATDRLGDPHSPVIDSMAWSHVMWIFAADNRETDYATVEDLAAFPELRFLDRFHHLVPIFTAGMMFGLGVLIGHLAPGSHTSGPQMFVWGFCVSTAVLYHSTFMVNSVAHRFGTRRFDTKDASRNVWWLALLTLGEGWHNNHHRFPGGARQGFGRYELDLTWLGLRALRRIGLVHNLRPVPPALLAAARKNPAIATVAPPG
jgi:stearoyl-CoA desaturase (delta-9 desaturase)